MNFRVQSFVKSISNIYNNIPITEFHKLWYKSNFKIQPCTLYEKNIKGYFINDGVSNSLKTVIELPNITVINDIPVNSVFIKIFPNLLSLTPTELKIIRRSFYKTPPSIVMSNIKDLLSDNMSLNYESSVYEHINQLSENKLSSQFPLYIQQTNCSLNNLLKLINLADIDLGSDEENRDRYLYDSLVVQLTAGGDFNLRQHSNYEMKQVFNNFNKLKYTYALVEGLPDAYHLDDFLKYNSMFLSNESDYFKKILLQIAIACYSLSLLKVVHNDIHFGNIMLYKLKNEEIYSYIINGKQYSFKAAMGIKIIDFDRAYAVKYGENPLIHGGLCTQYGQCNVLIPNKDIIQVLSTYLLNIIGNRDMTHKTLNYFSKNPTKTLKEIRPLHNYENTMTYKPSGKSISPYPKSIYKKEFYSCTEIIDRIYNDLDTVFSFDDNDIKHTYILNATDFDKKGDFIG